MKPDPSLPSRLRRPGIAFSATTSAMIGAVMLVHGPVHSLDSRISYTALEATQFLTDLGPEGIRRYLHQEILDPN